jgi:nucleoid-associated protein EbfC
MDIQGLMRQAQEMQKKMQASQEEQAKTNYDGSAGGGMVKVVINGAGMGKEINIDESLLQADEKDILEDLIIAAFNDAKKKADDGSSDSLKSLTNGIPLPPGFKL